MKTIKVASGIMGALAIASAMGLAACSAETGSPGEGAIGTTTQALNLASARSQAASCAIQDPSNTSHYFMLVAGGESSAGTVLNTVELIDPSTGGLVTLNAPATFSQARRAAKMLPIPGSPQSCLLIGGEDGTGSAISTDPVRVLTLTKPNANYTVSDTSVAADSTGFTPRSNLAASPCMSSSIIAIGGDDGGNSQAAIEVYKGIGVGWASPSTANLVHTRKTFGFAVADNGSLNKFVVAGGFDSNAVATSQKVETIEASRSGGMGAYDCDTTSVTDQGVQLGVSGGSNYGRNEPAAFDRLFTAASGGNPATSKIIVAGGDDGTNPRSTTDEVTVNWTNHNISSVVNGPALTTTVRKPVFVKSGTDFVLVGGYTNHAKTAVANAQKYGTPFAALTTGLTTARAEAAVEAIVNVNVAGGFDGTNFLSSYEQITP